MKTWKQGIIGILAIIALAFTACDDGNGKDDNKKPPLSGNVIIDGTLAVGEELTANIDNLNGTANKYTFQWTRDGELNIIAGKTSVTYTVTDDDVGLKLGVIVTNKDTDGSKFGETLTSVPPYMETLTIGTLPFEVVCRKDDTASWEKLKAMFAAYDTSVTSNPGSAPASVINNLINKRDKPEGAIYRVVVDYSEDGKDTGFAATNGQVATVGGGYLANPDTPSNRGPLQTVFTTMFNTPWPLVDPMLPITRDAVRIGSHRVLWL